MESTTLAVQPGPDAASIDPKLQDIVPRAQAALVRNNDEYMAASGMLIAITGLRDEIAATFNPHIKAAHDLHKALLTQRKKFDEPLDLAETLLKQRVGKFLQEEERKRRDEERRLQEQERLRAEAEEKERKRQAQEQALADAIAAEQAGNAGAAEKILTVAAEEAAAPAPVYVAPVVIASSVPRISGMSLRETWSATVTDLMALVKAVAAGTVPLEAVAADMVFLRRQATALKGNLRYPGVQSVSSSSMAVRG